MKMINKNFALPVFFILLFSSSSILNAEEAEYQLGLGLMAFNYAEYLDTNVFLDGETGFIPGLVFKRKKYNKNSFTELTGKVHGNIIKYDGETQSGIPVTTNSIAIIFDGHIKVGKQFAGNYEPYIGLGYRYWYRNILNGSDIFGNPVVGLLEEYYWPYPLLGYGVTLNSTAATKVNFDLRITRMFNAKMDIDFLGFKGYDHKQVNLGNRSGVRFALPIQTKTGKNLLTVTPYYEMILIGKSNSVVITQSGVPVTGCMVDPCQLYEPRSETHNIGIDITWMW